MYISVVIPLYNKEKYILRAIDSVLAQTHFDFELIVVDDGSTDNSAKLVNTIKDKRVTLVSQANGGVSKARNTGVRKAKARWVAFLDADDEYEPDFLKEAASFLKNNAHSNLSFIGANYYIGSKSRVAHTDVIKSGIYDYFTLFGNQKSPNHSSTTVINKDVFLSIGGFPEGIKQFEDWIAWFKLGLSGNFGYLSTPLGVYHFVENSVARTKRNPVDFFSDAKILAETTRDFAKKNQTEKSKTRNFTKQVNDFSVSISEILAREEEKNLAIKMLSLISFNSTKEMPNIKKLMNTFFYLALPQIIKRTYRRLRWRTK